LSANTFLKNEKGLAIYANPFEFQLANHVKPSVDHISQLSNQSFCNQPKIVGILGVLVQKQRTI
jgi:hypothetical protein